MVLPELFRGILAGYALEDLSRLAQRRQLLRACRRTLLATWVLILESGQVVDVLVYDDPQAVGLVVGRNVRGGEGLGHGDVGGGGMKEKVRGVWRDAERAMEN